MYVHTYICMYIRTYTRTSKHVRGSTYVGDMHGLRMSCLTNEHQFFVFGPAYRTGMHNNAQSCRTWRTCLWEDDLERQTRFHI